MGKHKKHKKKKKKKDYGDILRKRFKRSEKIYSKILLFANVIFLMFGMALFIFGMVDKTGYMNKYYFPYVIPEKVPGPNPIADTIELRAFAAIGFGGTFIFISLLGTLGILQMIIPILSLYVFLLVVVVLVQSAVCVFVVVNTFVLPDIFLRQLYHVADKYFVTYISFYKKPYSTAALITDFINFVQVKYQCCGILKFQDITHSSSFLSSNRKDVLYEIQMPYSCCGVEPTKRKKALEDIRNIRLYIKDCRCAIRKHGTFLNQKVCGRKFVDELNSQSIVVLIALCICAVIEVAVVITTRAFIKSATTVPMEFD